MAILTLLVFITTLSDCISYDIKKNKLITDITSMLSIKRNLLKAINLDNRVNNLSCLDGLRMIMTFNVIIYHTYNATTTKTRDNDKILLLDRITSEVSIILDVYPSMNIFIMITGCITSFRFKCGKYRVVGILR